MVHELFRVMANRFCVISRVSGISFESCAFSEIFFRTPAQCPKAKLSGLIQYWYTYHHLPVKLTIVRNKGESDQILVCLASIYSVY